MKTSSISRRVAVIRCSRPSGVTGVPGSVTSIASAASRASSSAAASSSSRAATSASTRLARLVGGPADRAALLRRQLGDAAQQVRQLGLAAEVGDARVLELVRGGGGG